MTRTREIPPPTTLDWVLVANASRARCFERDADNNAMRELYSFVHPQSRLKGHDLASDRGGLARKSQASTQFAPHTDRHQKEHAEFARELSAHLEEAALGHRYPGLVLIASAPFLGDLRAHLGNATKPLLRASVPLDLTTCAGAYLELRVAQALLPSEAAATTS